MSEPNILLTRIDNRLIHGQVATQWNGTLGANLILVANNKVAGDKTRLNTCWCCHIHQALTRFISSHLVIRD